MNPVQITWNTRNKIGKIRKLNGGNMAPHLNTEMAGKNIRKPFSELNLAFTRLHDSPLGDANCRLVDISNIFPLFHLDENDSRNYYFTQTDDYLHNCIVDAKTPVFYRLGESIDHSINKYFINKPESTEKWINICSNIIRHYTEGLWNGFHYDIKYWEIWNEPECDGNKRLDPNAKPLMWLGTLDEFNQFFSEAAIELKKRFPHLKFGGPAHCGFDENKTNKFLKYCADHNTPLDFYSYHGYTGDPYGWIQETPALIRATLDKYGYKNTEIHLNEWHYFPGDWHRLRNDSDYKNNMYEHEMKGLDAATFVNVVMARWEDTPLDYGAYYTCNSGSWGIFVTNSNKKTPAFYGMKAFGEIVRYPVRLDASSDKKEVTVLAGENEKGEKALLLAAFKTGTCDFCIDADIPLTKENCEVLLLDEGHCLQPAEQAEFRDGKVYFSSDSFSAVAIVKIR